MVTEILLILISYLIRFVAWLLPSWELPSFIIDSFQDIVGGVFALDFILPITEVAQVALIIFTFEITLLTARTIAGVVSLIRGGGSLNI